MMIRTLRIDGLNDRTDLTLVTDRQDVSALREHLTRHERTESQNFDGFFVSVVEGDYKEVYGFHGTIPYLYKVVYRIR